MRYLFDLQHPAHLHFFRNLILELKKLGHEVLITGRDKDILVELAQCYQIPIVVFGKARPGVLRLATELIYRQSRLWGLISSFKPDVMMAIAGTFISSLGWLRRIPTYVFYDTEHATISNLLAYPFCRCVYVPRCYRGQIRWRHQRYPGYHELAYLHPNYFSADPGVLAEAGLRPGQRFALVRFVAWGAAHDIGLKGLTDANKRRLVTELSRYGRVLISSEAQLPEDLEPYRLQLPVHRMHHLLAHASLIFGESATMCSEGAVLGVPGVYIDPVGRGYTDEQERDYGLVYNFDAAGQDLAIQKGVELFSSLDDTPWKDARRRLLADKIDVTQMLLKIALERPFNAPNKSELSHG